MRSEGAPEGWCHAFSSSPVGAVYMAEGQSSDHVCKTREVSKQIHFNDK